LGRPHKKAAQGRPGEPKALMSARHICCILATAGLLAPGLVEARTLSGEEAVAAEGHVEAAAVQLKDIAIGILSGREEYFKPVASAMLRYAPRGVLLKAEGRCPCNFRAGFAALIKKHPDAMWYYIADDDVIIMLDKLVKMLRAYGEDTPRVLAGSTMAKYIDKCGGGKEEAPWSEKDDPLGGHCMFGGTGMIMSGPMARQLKWHEPCKCDMNDSDLEMTCFLGRSWNSSFRFEGLRAEKGFGNNPMHNDIIARHPYESMVVVHHVGASTLTDITDRNHVVGDAVRTVQEVIKDAEPLVGACCNKDTAPSLAEDVHGHSEPISPHNDAVRMVRREST